MSEIATGPVKTININENTGAANVIVALVASRKIRILGFTLVAAAAVTATWEDTDGLDIIGPVDLILGTPWTVPVSNLGSGDTPAGKGLNLLLGGAVQVGGSLTYQEVK